MPDNCRDFCEADHARERRRRAPGRIGLAERLNASGKECAALPDFDTRSADEIIGYDEFGVPR